MERTLVALALALGFAALPLLLISVHAAVICALLSGVLTCALILADTMRSR